MWLEASDLLPRSYWTFRITQSWIFKPQHASLSHPRTLCELKKNAYSPTCSQRGKTIMGDFWGSRPFWDTVRPITVWEGIWILRVYIYIFIFSWIGPKSFRASVEIWMLRRPKSFANFHQPTSKSVPSNGPSSWQEPRKNLKVFPTSLQRSDVLTARCTSQGTASSIPQPPKMCCFHMLSVWSIACLFPQNWFHICGKPW